MAQRWRLASLSFSFGQPPALRASPFHGKGVDGFLPLLPPSSGRRWRVAPEVGFALFRLRPTPCPSSMPLPWEGAWYEMTSISTLSHCQSKSGPRIGVRQSFQPASVIWFYCTHLDGKTQDRSWLPFGDSPRMYLPPPTIYIKCYKSSENALMKLTLCLRNTLIKLYNRIEKYLIKLYNEVKSTDYIA